MSCTTLKDGWSASDFHSKCNNKGALVFFMRTTDDAVIGAYTTVSWNSSGTLMRDDNAFLFEINAGGKMVKCPVFQNHGNALYGKSDYGPTFGGGNHDLRIPSMPNTTNCAINVGPNTYQAAPTGMLSAGSKTSKLKALVAVAVM